MWKALVIKELRDLSFIIAALAVVSIAWAATTVGVHMPLMQTHSRLLIPFLSNDLVSPLWMIGIAAGTGLGLRQATCSLSEKSSQFLLHRPVERWQLIGMKLAVGQLLVVTLLGGIVTALTLLASLPGGIAAPFELWMTIPGWIAVYCATLTYSAAFLSGLRPARWFGTRLFPVIGMISLALAISLISHWSPVIGLLIVIVLNGLVWIAIQSIASSRDYA